MQRWGYRRLTCGSFAADVSQKRFGGANGDKQNGEGKDWEKLPKQDAAAQDLMETGILPKDLDWVDRSAITSWSEMGGPGTTETSQVHPYHFTTSIAKLAQDGGARIQTRSKVTKIGSSKTSPDLVEYTDLETGETKALGGLTDIIVTAGPWTGKLLPRAKVEGLRAHSVVYEADVSPYAVFTDIRLPKGFVPEHRAKMGQKRMHTDHVDPEIYARPFGEVYACGK